MLTLVTHNGIQEYTHPNMPSVVISNTARFKENTSELLEIEKTWTVNGFLASTDGNIQTQVIALKAHYIGMKLTSAQIKDGVTVLETLPTDLGICVESLNFPEGSGAEWATKRNYVLTLKGIDYVGTVESFGEYTYTITYATDQSGNLTITINGELSDITGKNALDKYETLKFSKGWFYFADCNIINDIFTQNDNNTKITFTITAKEYWAAFPSGITDGSYDIEETLDNQNVTRVRVSGWFEGPVQNCMNAITTLTYSDVLISKSVSRNNLTNRTSFSLEFLLLSNDILYRQETTTVTPQIYDFIHKQILGGRNPIKQVIAKTVATATQSGTLKRLKIAPLVPPPIWPLSCVKKHTISRITSEYNTYRDCFVYTLNYSYEFEFSSTPIWNI